MRNETDKPEPSPRTMLAALVGGHALASLLAARIALGDEPAGTFFTLGLYDAQTAALGVWGAIGPGSVWFRACVVAVVSAYLMAWVGAIAGMWLLDNVLAQVLATAAVCAVAWAMRYRLALHAEVRRHFAQQGLARDQFSLLSLLSAMTGIACLVVVAMQWRSYPHTSKYALWHSTKLACVAAAVCWGVFSDRNPLARAGVLTIAATWQAAWFAFRWGAYGGASYSLLWGVTEVAGLTGTLVGFRYCGYWLLAPAAAEDPIDDPKLLVG